MSLGRCINGHMYRIDKYGNKCPYCDSPLEDTGKMKIAPILEESEKTKEPDNIEGVEPVVGWLVCIEGIQMGKDYKIRKGSNFIGRSEEMDISIAGDNTISKTNHASITYDPKMRKFTIAPGESGGLIYLSNQEKKDEPVLNAEELSAFDVIEIGKSKFIFINLCGPNFNWSYKEEKAE